MTYDFDRTIALPSNVKKALRAEAPSAWTIANGFYLNWIDWPQQRWVNRFPGLRFVGRNALLRNRQK